MKDGLTPGLAHKQNYVTTPEMRAKQLGSNVPSIFSTPSMIGLMERTCVELLTPYMDENEQTVGIHVDVKHLAPTHIGQSVTIAATLLEIKDKRFRFSVEATSDHGVKIGEGIHRRALINVKEFNTKAP